MLEKQQGKTKIYIVIGLSLVLVTVGYFRFIHKKAASTGDSDQSDVPAAQFDVPEVAINTSDNDQKSAWPGEELFGTVISDIFTPLQLSKKAETQPGEEEPSKPASCLKLRGTIVGGGKPIAIIDDQFVCKGDWIGEYQVIGIGKKEVLLASGNEKITVEMVVSNE